MAPDLLGLEIGHWFAVGTATAMDQGAMTEPGLTRARIFLGLEHWGCKDCDADGVQQGQLATDRGYKGSKRVPRRVLEDACQAYQAFRKSTGEEQVKRASTSRI